MRQAFSLLENVIKKACGQGPVYYFANPGNLGDALIRHGTLKFFRDIGLTFTELKGARKKDWFLPFLRGGTVIYGGGGAWCRLWTQSEDFVTKLRRRFRVIVLPSTYELHYAMPGVIFFCRDLFESRQNMPEAHFCHDMAFYLGRLSGKDGEGEGKGYIFRGDGEGRIERERIPVSNFDISAQGTHLSEISSFLEHIQAFRTIYTDRLHVAIAACLLGKEVHLYPGAYFKNRAVYLSSMRDYFDNVYFHEEFNLP